MFKPSFSDEIKIFENCHSMMQIKMEFVLERYIFFLVEDNTKHMLSLK
jgi:hypothetical protein